MKSSLAWCLEPEYCEREKVVPGQHRTGAYVRRTAVRENFARVREQAPTLKAAGLAGPAIATELGVSVDSVYRALREAGIRRSK